MKKKAFTLIELLIAMAIFAVIMASLSLLLRTGIKSFLHGYFSTQLLEEASTVFSDRGSSRGLISCLRESGGIVKALPSEISFMLRGGTVTYLLDGNKVIKRTAAGENILSGCAGDFSFRYYSRTDGKWAETSSAAEAGAVAAYLKLVKGGSSFSCVSGAFLRNGAK